MEAGLDGLHPGTVDVDEPLALGNADLASEAQLEVRLRLSSGGSRSESQEGREKNGDGEELHVDGVRSGVLKEGGTAVESEGQAALEIFRRNES